MLETETLKQIVLTHLEQGVQKFLSEKKLSPERLKIRIEYSRNEKFGDYSTSFLLENKDILGNPTENSNLLLECLKPFEPIFSEITFTQPGFINFRIHSKYLKKYVLQVFSKEDVFVKTQKPQKIIFEFVSANPTGPLNIVSARAAATGDSICNLLEISGHNVFREYYVNDYGNQVFLLGVSCLCRLREFLGEAISFQEDETEYPMDTILEKNILPKDGYRGEYLKEIALQIYEENKSEFSKKLSEKKYYELAEKYSKLATNKILESQKSDLQEFGVEFDNFYSERSLHENNKVLQVLESLKEFLFEQDGKKIFLSTRFGDDKDRVVVREDGRPTYLLADIAYHKTKIDRGFNKIIDIWGPDHHGYIARLSGAIQALGFSKEDFQVIIAQQVNLLSKGEKLKMSKRLGKFQTMKDLLEYLGEHGKDVARYFFVMRALETPLDFDLDLAKEESEKNPVFYVQYAHARICSIFREVEINPNEQDFLNLELTEERERLLFYVARFPEENWDAAINMEPHRITVYLLNLCKAFSRFYVAKENKLKECERETRNGLGYLCFVTRTCIQKGLNLLGISAPEKMEKEI